MSHIVKHDWNGYQIGQAVADFKLNGKLVPAGYVDLSSIANAGNKNVKRFLDLDSTKELVQALSEKDDKTVLSPPAGFSEVFQTFFPSMARPKHPPVISVLGRGGGAYGCIEIALELCAWVNIDLKIWGLRTLTKVLTGKPITNADRAEGWAKVSQLGLNLEVEAPTSKSIESDVSPELADSFRKTEWVIRKSLELGISAEEVQKIFLNFESVKPKSDRAASVNDRPSTANTKPKEIKTPKSPHYHLVKDWFAECLEFDRDSSVQMGADRDIPSQLYGSFSKFLINKGCDQQISHAAFSATLKEFVGLELKSNPSIRFKSPNNKRTLYGVRLR